jgi:hypothetical protein
VIAAVDYLVPDDGATRQAFTELRPVDEESLVQRGGHKPAGYASTTDRERPKPLPITSNATPPTMRATVDVGHPGALDKRDVDLLSVTAGRIAIAMKLEQ